MEIYESACCLAAPMFALMWWFDSCAKKALQQQLDNEYLYKNLEYNALEEEQPELLRQLQAFRVKKWLREIYPNHVEELEKELENELENE